MTKIPYNRANQRTLLHDGRKEIMTLKPLFMSAFILSDSRDTGTLYKKIGFDFRTLKSKQKSVRKKGRDANPQKSPEGKREQITDWVGPSQKYFH